MNDSANRLRLVEAFRGIRRLPVSVVGHSIGSTINIGFGATTPRRYTKHRTGKRRTGYLNRAERNLSCQGQLIDASTQDLPPAPRRRNRAI